MIEIPNFTIEKEVGRGGMALVYLAEQDMLGRKVALKVLLPDMVKDETLRNSFLSEGKTIANLEHPNIVRIHDIGIVNESIFYMAMEYLSGGTLKERLVESKLSYEVSLKFLTEISKGLSYAHSKGYIHRDIKPGNILFRDDGTAVLTDFGIAKLQDTSGDLTRLGFTLGTVQYMSPEQATTTELDSRSDIYSLGLVFYEMLTGQKAFKADSNIQAIHQHTTVPPPKLPEEYAFLQSVMDKVLAKEPSARYQSSDEFVYAVQTAKHIPAAAPLIDSENTIYTDETVIHRITPESRPVPPAPTDVSHRKKSGNSAFSAVLGGLIVIGVMAFGVFKFTDFFDGANTSKLVKQSIEEKSPLRLKQDTLAQQEIEAQERKHKEALVLALAKKQKAEEEKQASLIRQKQEEERIALEAKKAADEEQEKERLRLLAEEEALAKKKLLENKRKQTQARLAQEKAEKEKHEKEIAAEKAKEKERLKQAMLAKQRAETEAKEREHRKKQALLAEKKLAEEKRILARKAAKSKELERKKAAEALAKKKANQRAKEKQAIAKKKAELERKRKLAAQRALAKKRAEAERLKQQQALRGQIQVAVTLNNKPLNTKVVIRKNGKVVNTSNRAYSNFVTSPGNYVVTAYYGGTSRDAKVQLGANDMIVQRFAFRGSTVSVPAKPQPQPQTKPDSKWTHTHEAPKY